MFDRPDQTPDPSATPAPDPGATPAPDPGATAIPDRGAAAPTSDPGATPTADPGARPDGPGAAPTPAARPDGPDAGIARLPFDRALGELQTVVGRLETGGLPLEESIALYERGVALHEHCARLLSDAEVRVQRLVEQAGGTLRALDFDPDEGET